MKFFILFLQVFTFYRFLLFTGFYFLQVFTFYRFLLFLHHKLQHYNIIKIYTQINIYEEAEETTSALTEDEDEEALAK
jgi:hypothetical protein